ncbi:MAG: methionine synthase [Anaerolineae bacterium]|nr:methionine synthase [Anaerolineae bacterium]
MAKFEPGLRSLTTGSLPFVSPPDACELILSTVDIPTWPQLPRRSFLENMYVQFSEGFPGMVVTGEQIYVDRDRGLDRELEKLYMAYLTNDLQFAAIGPEYAAGLHCFLGLEPGKVAIAKGQVTGPVSWGLMVSDEKRSPVLYDDVLAEAVCKHLRLKAAWQEQQLREMAQETILLIDEPYLSAFGSEFLSLSREQVVALLEEVFAGIEGLKGVHSCGDTDWSLVLGTSADIVSLDAYEHAEALALYPGEVAAFLERGGVIAWGIVPASKAVSEESVGSLLDRFHAAVDLLVIKGMHRDDVLAASLIIPSCGLGSLDPETARRVLHLTGQVAGALQQRYAR